MNKKGMGEDMYLHIIKNLHKVNLDLETGILTTPRGTKGTICSSTGYRVFSLNKRRVQLHQVIAVILFQEKCIGMTVNHIDGNKLNNKPSNLELLSHSDNLKHAYENGLMNLGDIRINQLDLDGNYLRTFSSVEEAVRFLGVSHSSGIHRTLKGTIKDNNNYTSNGKKIRTQTKAHGYKWEYA